MKPSEQYFVQRMLELLHRETVDIEHSFVNQTLTSNLRYYLTFSLSFLMDYFSGSNTEARNLQEFFALQQLRLDSLAHAKYPADKLIAFNHQFDFLA